MSNKQEMTMIKVAFTLIICCILLTPSISNGVTGEEEKHIAKWTIMYYLCCENHISYEAEEMVKNLTKVGSSENLNIIVLKDGGQQDDSALYYIEKDEASNLNKLYSWPDELDMGDSNTLKTFLNLVIREYPAKHYALMILSDCGSGWQGICRDTGARNNGIPLMSIPSFASVLKEVTSSGGKKIDVVGFMPCVMGMFEVAYEIAPYVNYMVASEEHQLEELDKGPEYTWQYLQTTWDLKNNTDMTSEGFALDLVERFTPCDFPMWVLYSYMVLLKKGEYGHMVETISNLLTNLLNKLPNPDIHLVSLHTTLSAVNLSRTDDVAEAVDNLSSILMLNKYDEQVIHAVGYARKNVREYGKFYSKNRATAIYYMNLPIEKLAFNSFVDLYDLAQLINESVENQAVKDACKEVMDKIKDAVVVNQAMPDDESHGCSIYFPENKNLYNKYLWSDELPYPYEEMRFSQDTSWDDFLKTYLGV
ncbi:MAG TPA: hypothetical protein ENL13_00320 [Thermoplasmatales archaeon]|nr:hypothetical protein [Thermoplasmatales archaeon]